MLLKTLFTSGTYVHWRNFMALWQVLNGKNEQQGLKLQQLPPDTFGVPGCRNSYWISLDPSRLKDAPPAKASCVLMFLHGKHTDKVAPPSVAGSMGSGPWRTHTLILPVLQPMCAHEVAAATSRPSATIYDGQGSRIQALTNVPLAAMIPQGVRLWLASL